MKNLFWVIFGCITMLVTKTHSQSEGIAVFKIKALQNESENPENKNINKNTLLVLKNTEREFENLEYELIFNKEISLFKEIEKIDKSNNTYLELAKTLSGYSGEVYVDIKKQLIIEVKDVMGKKYFLEKKIKDYNWEIDKNKVVVNGYDCFKATTILTTEGRNGIQDIEIIAWFTPEINLPYGPIGFSGLPGMIIQIQRGNFITYLSDIKFQANEEKIQLPTDETISSKEFNEMMKKMNSNRGNY